MEHRASLTRGAVIAVLVLALGAGSWWFWDYRNQQASAALAKAMTAYQAPVIPPGSAPEGQQPPVSFPTEQDRSNAAHSQFQEVANRYGLTKSGQVARYMAATTAIDLGDTKNGEAELSKVAGSGNADLAALAKLALAGVYRNTNRPQDALRTYQDLVNHPTASVSKTMAQVELASLYEEIGQPAEATKLYGQILKSDPRSAAAMIAQQRLETLKQ